MSAATARMNVYELLLRKTDERAVAAAARERESRAD